MAQTRRGIREVPPDIDVNLRNFLLDVRQAVTDIYNPKQGLITPTNFTGTAIAQGAHLQWTRSNGDYYEILWSEDGTLKNANVVDVGDSAQWTDFVGNAAHTRWYWARSARTAGEKSIEAGPAKVTTLAAGTNVTPPVPPPSGSTITSNPTTQNLGPRGRNLT